jgi:hypothetical protein
MPSCCNSNSVPSVAVIIFFNISVYVRIGYGATSVYGFTVYTAADRRDNVTVRIPAWRDAAQLKTCSLGSSARARKAFSVGRSSIGFLFAELV